MDAILERLYYREKNFDGVEQLYKKAKPYDKGITKEKVRDWLKRQKVSQLVTEKKVGVRNIYLPIYSDMQYSFQIDLTFFPRYTKQNKGYNVLFTAINVNTRFAYADIAKNKDMNTILDIIKKMEKKTVINSFTCDEGGEFNNKQFIKFCKERNIRIYFIKNDSHKLGIINRFHRTIKNKLTKYFIANDTVKWYDVIDDIVNNYNNSVNRGIGIEPIKVNDFIENLIIHEKKAQTGIIKPSLPDFVVGDKVILKNKNILFEDKMKPSYSNKIYNVIGVTANSLKLERKGKEKKVKKSQARKINENDFVVVENNIEDVLDNVARERRAERRLKKSGVDVENIVEGKRQRKANKRYL